MIVAKSKYKMVLPLKERPHSIELWRKIQGAQAAKAAAEPVNRMDPYLEKKAAQSLFSVNI